MLAKIVTWVLGAFIAFIVLVMAVSWGAMYFGEPTSNNHAMATPSPAQLRQQQVQRAVNRGEAQLVAHIKSGMHDPGSFELVDDRAIDAGDHITMVMTYRGRNGFNALRLEKVAATLDLQGNVTSVQNVE